MAPMSKRLAKDFVQAEVVAMRAKLKRLLDGFVRPGSKLSATLEAAHIALEHAVPAIRQRDSIREHVVAHPMARATPESAYAGLAKAAVEGPRKARAMGDAASTEPRTPPGPPCSRCTGSRVDPDSPDHKCARCHGTGVETKD